MDDIEREFRDHIDDENNNQATLDDNDIMNELFGDEAEEAQEAPERQIKMVNVVTESEVTKVKRPRRTLLKLDLEKLFSERGLSAIPGHIKPLKFKGKGHELEDITSICRAYEHWAHRLYPKMTFRDVLEKIEHLGMKNRKRCIIHKSKIYDNERRLHAITGGDRNNDDDDDAAWPEPQENEIFGENKMQPDDTFGSFVGTSYSTPAPPPVPSSQQSTPSLTEEQLERMRHNRLKALQKKKERDSGIGVKTNEMSPLARADNQDQHTTNNHSSESDYQAPSKRFKPDSAESEPSLSFNLNCDQSNQLHSNITMCVESEQSHKQENINDVSMSSPSHNRDRNMSFSETTDYNTLNSEDVDQTNSPHSLDESARPCLLQGEPMIGDIDADIANEINDLID